MSIGCAHRPVLHYGFQYSKHLRGVLHHVAIFPDYFVISIRISILDKSRFSLYA